MLAVLAGVVLITHPGYPAVLAAGIVAGAITFFGVDYGLMPALPYSVSLCSKG